ncbi:cupin domain-containing protein [Robiginitalea sp. IMCC43444]|uniref:cupin domain-containing protein n=1 Tax=Robiginitalea sp. IMCC43444 TaxID=3459121 RepID=UPI004041E09E
MEKIFSVLIVLGIFGCTGGVNKEDALITLNETEAPNYELDYMVEKWSESFVTKIDSAYRATINFYLADSSEACHVLIAKNNFELVKQSTDSFNLSFSATKDHYNKIFRGDITAMTSMGQATSSDPIPLNFEIQRAISDNATNDFIFVAQRFFNTTPYDLVKLGQEHARVVHGGLAIPIFYQKADDIGVRSAWYQINKGEQVNEPGDTNPFPQYFIITQGQGYAKIGNDTIAVKENEAYFIPPDHDHVFWNENDEPIIYIFLAWGKGA